MRNSFRSVRCRGHAPRTIPIGFDPSPSAAASAAKATLDHRRASSVYGPLSHSTMMHGLDSRRRVPRVASDSRGATIHRTCRGVCRLCPAVLAYRKRAQLPCQNGKQTARPEEPPSLWQRLGACPEHRRSGHGTDGARIARRGRVSRSERAAGTRWVAGGSPGETL